MNELNEFHNAIFSLIKDCREYFHINYSIYVHKWETDITCQINKNINVKYIGSRIYEEGEIIDNAPYDYDREFFKISFKVNYTEFSGYVCWCTWGEQTLSDLDYYEGILTEREAKEDIWTLSNEVRVEFMKIFYL